VDTCASTAIGRSETRCEVSDLCPISDLGFLKTRINFIPKINTILQKNKIF
jgi:hypothetical protein